MNTYKQAWKKATVQGWAEKFIGWLRSNSGLWKVVVLETFREYGKLTNGVLFHQDNAPVRKSLIAMAAGCDWIWTGWSPSIFSWFGTIWLFSVPQHEKRRSMGPIMRSAVEYFVEEQDESNNDGQSVWTAGETRLKYKPHLVQIDHCIIVSLWTFQPTLVLLQICKQLYFLNHLLQSASYDIFAPWQGFIIKMQSYSFKMIKL